MPIGQIWIGVCIALMKKCTRRALNEVSISVDLWACIDVAISIVFVFGGNGIRKICFRFEKTESNSVETAYNYPSDGSYSIFHIQPFWNGILLVDFRTTSLRSSQIFRGCNRLLPIALQNYIKTFPLGEFNVCQRNKLNKYIICCIYHFILFLLSYSRIS